MANASIPSLPVAVSLDGTEQIEIVQPPGVDGTTKRTTVGAITTLAVAATGSVAALSVMGNSSSAPSTIIAIGPATANQVFRADTTASTIGWGQVNLSSTSAITGFLSFSYMTGTLPTTSLPAIAGLSLLGVSGTSTATPDAITGTANQIPAVNASGTLLSFNTTTQINTTLASLYNRTLSKTASYTMTPSDDGALMALSGSFITLAFPAASGMNATQRNVVTNESSTRAQKITISGGTDFLLYPGQTVTVYNDSNVWKSTGPYRWRLTGTVTFNVDPTGSDTATDGLGTGTSAFATLQKATNVAYDNLDVSGYLVVVKAADGTYTAAGPNILMNQALAGGHPSTMIFPGSDTVPILFRGNTASPGNVILASTTGVASVLAVNGAAFGIEGFKITAAGYGILAAGEAQIQFGNNVFATSGSAKIGSFHASIVENYGNCTVQDNSPRVIESNYQSAIYLSVGTMTVGNSFTVTEFAKADRDSDLTCVGFAIDAGGNTVTGKRFTVSNLASINPNTGSLLYFPGTSDGTAINGTYNNFFTEVDINANSTALPSSLAAGAVLRVAGANTGNCLAELRAFSGLPAFLTSRAGGTAESPSAVGSGAQLNSVGASYAYDGTAYGVAFGVNVHAAQTWSVGSHGARAEVIVVPNGTTVGATVLGFEQDGGIIVPRTVTSGSLGAGSINANILGIGGFTVKAVATSANAADLTTGTLPAARLPAFGAGDVSFVAAGGTGTIAANAVTDAKLRQGGARTVIGVTGNATANVADIQGSALQLLQVNVAGTGLIFTKLLGTATTDTASAGQVGEYISSGVLAGSAVSLTTNTRADVTAISLTAGDWDVSGVVAFSAAATTTLTLVVGWLNTVSVTFPTVGSDAGSGYQQHYGTWTQNVPTCTFGPVRLSLSATTTTYLGAFATFSVSTATAYGLLRARRVR